MLLYTIIDINEVMDEDPYRLSAQRERLSQPEGRYMPQAQDGNASKAGPVFSTNPKDFLGLV